MGVPLVSAIVPVHNRASLVGQAVASLARQTLDSFEIIVIDDGSTDGSAEVAEIAGEGRTRVVRHSRNRGIPAARNSGLEEARGKFIAWLDSDDTARPDRLVSQVRFLTEHPEVALVGGCSGRIDVDGHRRIGARVPFLAPEVLEPALLFRTPISQTTIMGRAEVLKEHPYRPEFAVCEDLDLYLRLSRTHRIANMARVLGDKRAHRGQIVQTERAQVRVAKKILLGEALARLGADPDDETLDRHISLGRVKNQPLPQGFLGWAEDWLATLCALNREAGPYDQKGLDLVCAKAWLLAYVETVRRTRSVADAKAFLRSPVRGFFNRAGRRWAAQALPILLGLTRGA